ncbi:MAG: hypothetical protein J0M12_01300 [Deltaproteobacteria bacterium]|nr:hypothetical protein [Deltaproteobacteria bacterium]
MNSEKVATFMALAGQVVETKFTSGTEAQRKLGAQLLLSEVLEYVIKGLGVTPEINGVKITDAEAVHYHAERAPNQTEMLDGLCDVAYTMYWNSNCFGLPLEPAYDLVCDNNLEKFVRLEDWARGKTELQPSEWDCKKNITWPAEVVKVSVVDLDGALWAVGKDARGKVRKPGSYKSVDLSSLLYIQPDAA